MTPLICPSCREPLSVTGAALQCPACHASFPIEHGIADFSRGEYYDRYRFSPSCSGSREQAESFFSIVRTVPFRSISGMAIGPERRDGTLATGIPSHRD